MIYQNQGWSSFDGFIYTREGWEEVESIWLYTEQGWVEVEREES